MQLKFEPLADLLRVEIRGRETPEETREAVEKTLAEREKHGVLAMLIVVRNSRAIFKVEDYGLSRHLARAAAIPGLRAATVTEDPSLYSAHQYLELLAAQRGVAFRAFRTEAEALAWLRSPR